MQFKAPTDFRVGQAIRSLREKKGLRIVVRYKRSANPDDEEYRTIRDLQTSGVRLLNDLVGYRYQNAGTDERKESQAVQKFCEVLIRSR